jgi:4-diphosphocytidyl-2-C-methyl-D-erythritol kinase
VDKITLQSPSKINIGLNIVETREDGYHNLETLFYPLLLCDEINFEKSNIFNIKSNSDEFNSLKSNLINTAKVYLENLTKKKLNVKIDVKKNIPIGGGLGGGSSNAATTLKALNMIFDLDLGLRQLNEIGLSLGSDAPYFLNPVPSLAKSRGELLSPIYFSISYPIVLVNPGIHISTKWAFENITPTNPEYRLNEIFRAKKINIKKLKKYVSNDFEYVVFKEYPEVKILKEKLYELGADFALMTGTGSSVFGIFSNLQDAYWAEEYFKEKYFTFVNNPFKEGSIT